VFRAIIILLFIIFAFQEFCFGTPLLETENLNLFLYSYLRKDLVAFNNVTDLDSNNDDDTTIYLGIDYSLAFDLQFKENNSKFYLKLERNGPFDYNLPLFVHNTLMTSGGVIEKYHNDELLPQLEEFWFDIPLLNTFRFKGGLYSYEVGYGFSLNGGYENYGFSIYRQSEDSTWRFYYCSPEIVYKNHLGPRIRQDEEQGVLYNPGAYNFFASDIKLQKEKYSLNPYVGILTDYTSCGKRDNLFSAPIEKEILGTAGIFWELENEPFSFKSEFAHNFGKAESSDASYNDITHTGYLFYAGVEYSLNKFTPSAQFLIGSGNKVSEDAALNQEATLASSKNRAFSSYSPLNLNLGDSISPAHSDIRPIVAMGSGNGLNYGIPRPGSLAASDFDNIIILSLGINYNLTENLSLGLFGYYLRSPEKAAGMLNGSPKYLSQELGNELDLLIDFTVNENILISFLGGYFSPGQYYKEERDDVDSSLLSPYLRGDGGADCAYHIELAAEFQF